MSATAASARIRRRRLLALGALLLALALAGWIVFGLLLSADTAGAEVTAITVDSADVGQSLPTNVVVPDGVDADGAPLLVFLHGRDGDADSYTGDEAMFEALSATRDAPVVAFPDGGDDSYWHDRAGGDWGSYVTDEVIPAVEQRFGTDPDRIAIGGISMGGFGALDLARLHPAAFCAVGGHSPALWTDGGLSAAGAFDDAEDFEAHDVVAAGADPEGAFSKLPVWIDEGEEDPFKDADVAFVKNLQMHTDLAGRIWPGGHDLDYWDQHWDEYFGFYAKALAGC
jgi:S-formylglutathione hydrolase FrmB